MMFPYTGYSTEMNKFLDDTGTYHQSKSRHLRDFKALNNAIIKRRKANKDARAARRINR